ncbi:MAG TPA: cyclic nucleotide-binding domain-containing protein [Ramlibacter sp.]|uniref:Crp/Fnr family transcriptional regulator n=1 Tax=Ramlibacter sp. TaxID=1917967 RepID=UPI002D159A94|nr:cyclic nucleotide-binding domain-containing protein [Ramlibacter sp.]HVZ43871.1 cyclic nucleotide-binding domain-containing protein [Ramlibacter sp.]
MATALPLEQQLQDAGLEILGCCDHLSTRPELLQQSTLLQDFTPNEADLVGEQMLHVRARPGQVLINEGDPSDWLMVLLSGTVDVGKRKVGGEGMTEEVTESTRLAVLREGAVIGEMSMIDGEPRYASCWALTAVDAAVLSRDGVARLIAMHPATGAKLLVKLTQLLAQRLRNTSNQLVKALRRGA